MKIKCLHSFILLCAFSVVTVQAQCDANNFTVSATPGICPADGNISVLLPGGSPCNGWQAILANPNGVETIQNVPSNGGPVNFGALVAGDYAIRLVNGATVIPYPSNPVQVTTSYQTMDISSTNQAPTCPTAANLFSPNGTLEISINDGGTGPFLYEVISLFGLQSFGPTTNTSHIFGNMEGGETISFTVTDIGCGVSQTQNPIIASNDNPISEHLNSRFRRRCAPECDTYDAVFFTQVFGQNRINTVQVPGNATISINGGSPQNLAVENVNGSNISFEYLPGLQGNDSYVLNFNDGCFAFSESGTTLPISDNLLQVNSDTVYEPFACTTIHLVNPKGFAGVGEDIYNMFCSTNNMIIEQEISAGVWINVPLVGGVTNNPLDSGNPFILPSSGHYRITASDNCHTVVEEFDTLPETDPLDQVSIRPSRSILEGTGAMLIDRVPGQTSNATIPSTTYEINPVPFTSSITINPSHPYTLGGSYTLNFPISYTTTINRSIIGDLPPGDYEITIIDDCLNQATTPFSINATSSYAPNIQALSACANSSSIVYDLMEDGVARGFFAGVEIELWTDNGSGALGTLVQGDMPPDGYSGQFNNLSDGDYILRFTGINFQSTNTNETFSAVTLSNADREFTVPVTIEAFQSITATTTGAFCDLNDSSSGIVIAEITGGTPTYPITFELFDAADLSSPLQAFSETDTAVTNHIFENVSNGNYLVRVTTPCDGIDLPLDLALAPIQPVTTSDNPVLCASGGDVELSINLPVSIFDITWTDDQGNTVGTGSPVTVTVVTPTTYTASYSLKSVFCPSASVSIDTILIDFFPDLSQVGTESTTCNISGADYTLSVELTGTPPYTVTGTGVPGIFLGNVWTSDPIPEGTDYDVTFEDANTCTTLRVSDIAPNCCVFQVTCPTFPAMTVECYDDLPSTTGYTEAAFEALGNADGLIGDFPCGIIEITAMNSPDTGNCNATITRTYTITEYEDTNANGVRDNGENVILNTLACQQTISVQDNTPPTFVENLPDDITVSCNAIPEAITLTAIDNCDSNVQVSFTEETIFSDTTDDFVIERLWEATDTCDNVEMFQQTIIVQPEIETVVIEICVEDNAVDLINSLPVDFDTNGVFEIVSGNGILNGSLLDPSGFEVGEHQISYRSVEGTCKYFVDFTIQVDTDCIPCGISQIEISEAVTANADGVNDFFEINGVEFCGFTFEVQIFNRWGKIVHESSNYKNDWSGFSPNKSFGSSGTLPSGTYYYIINIKDSELKPINGFIYLGTD